MTYAHDAHIFDIIVEAFRLVFGIALEHVGILDKGETSVIRAVPFSQWRRLETVRGGLTVGWIGHATNGSLMKETVTILQTA